MMQIGTVKEIRRYAVKSMAGEMLDECTVGTMGIPGDRGWALRDETTGEITNAKKFPVLMQCAATYRAAPSFAFIPQVDVILPDGTKTASDAGDVNDGLSEQLGPRFSICPSRPTNATTFYGRKSKTAS